MRPSSAICAAALVLTVPLVGSASPAANSCERTVEVVDRATTIVFAKAKSLTTSRKGTSWVVRVTYAVDTVLIGKKATDLVVEESCETGLVPDDLVGYPGVARYCSSPADHELPGLTSTGTVGSMTSALLLVDGKSELDGSAVFKVVRADKWSPCPNETALLAKRPTLAALAAKVTSVQAKSTFGLPAPAPSGAPLASASSTAAPVVSTAAPPSGSSAATTTSATTSPKKNGGCSTVSHGASQLSGLALLVAACLTAARRAGRP